MVKEIAAVHGRKVRLVKGFGWLLKIAAVFVGVINKAFGNLSYEKEISIYKENYVVKSLSESINETER